MTNRDQEDRYDTQSVAGFLQAMVRKGRTLVDKRQQVLSAVKAANDGRSRTELVSLMEHEMARSGLPRDPIWVEEQFEKSESSPWERLRELLSRLCHLRRAVRGLDATTGRLSQLDTLEEQRSEPQWMRPPFAARYPAATYASESTAVNLEETSASYLGEVFEHDPHRLGSVALVDVWFDQAREANGAQIITANIGSKRVGVLDGQASERVAEAMALATIKGMKPVSNARMVRVKQRRPPFLLVVNV